MITNRAIQNLDDLLTEKQRLKQEIAACELKIRQDIEAIEDSLRPANMAVDMVKRFTKSDDSLIGNGIKNVVGQLAYNSVFAGYSWPVRTALSFLSKRVVGNLVQENAPGLIHKAANWWLTKRNAKTTAGHAEKEKPEFA